VFQADKHDGQSQNPGSEQLMHALVKTNFFKDFRELNT
jgi:hypothetical protein